MKINKLFAMVLVVCMLLSVLPAGFTAFAADMEDVPVAADVQTAETAAEAETADTGANPYGLAENVQDGQILQCWLWSYNNITNNLQKIAEQGFSAIQVSPIQPIKESTKEYWSTFQNSSWVIYQPVAFSIEDNYRNAQGTKTEFKAMCNEAHKYGIKVIVDTVFNHMANDMSDNTIHPWIPSELRTNSDCWHDITKNISNYDNRYETTHYCLTGLPDLNTANSIVQKHCTNFMKEAIDAGADGFRFDAVKHIETPSDSSSVRSNFWPNVLNAATEYAQETRDFTPYYYGELLGSPGSGISVSAYTQYMSVSDPGTSDNIRNGVCNGNASAAASGSVSNGAAKNKAVHWTESHDNHKDNGTNNISEHNINKTWAMIGSKDKICGLYLARPEDMDTTMMGDADMTSWSYPEVRAVNRFKNSFIGQSEYLSSYNKLACVERGTSGMIIVNTGGSYYDNAKVPVHKIASGTYEDAITGNTFTVSGGYISGDIGDTGIAVISKTDSVGLFTKGEITDYSIAGTMNNWDLDAHKLVAKDANTATVTMFLNAGTYTFKVTDGSLWYGNKGTIEDTTTEVGWTMRTSVDEKCTLKASGGKYTFTFNINTGKLVVMHDANTDKTSDVYLKGTFNEWGDANPMVYEEDTNTVKTSVALGAGTYEFKVHNTLMDAWYGNSGTINDTTGETAWTMKYGGDKCKLSAVGGTYTFSYNLSSNKLSVENSGSGVLTYVVTFKDWDGSVLSTQLVERGKAATAPSAPVREGNAQYTYTFKGWDKSFSNITANTYVTAQYTQTVNKYTVTFKDWDDKVLYTSTVEYGTAAALPPQEPTREGYTFSGWDADISSVKSNMTVNAVYTDNSTYLKGTFNNWDVTNKMTVTSNPEVVTTTVTLKAGTYEFKIHSKEEWYGNNGSITDTTLPTSNGWSMATGKDNCTLVASGGIYTFNFNTTTHRLEVLYEEAFYTVTFKDYDGEILSTQTVKMGEGATAPEAPVRENDAQYSYAFKRWDKDFSNITEDTVVTAVYTQTLNMFIVTFIDYDGTELFAQDVDYGGGAMAPDDPVRESDAQYTYTFKGWDKDFSYITEDTVVYAVYTCTVNKYNVTFKGFNGEELSVQSVEYGSSATAPEAPKVDGYTFESWDKDFSNITKDTVITAQYTKNTVVSKTGKFTVEVTGGTGFKISVNGGALRPQGPYYVNTKMPEGASVTVVANTVDGLEFLGWMNESGVIASTTDTYTFNASGNDYLKAVYMTVIEDVNVVLFKNAKASGGNGQILDMQYYAPGDEVEFPDAPSQAGYAFTGWSMTAEQIQAKLSAGEDVTVVANWEIAKVYIDVVVNGGKVTTTAQSNGKYIAYAALTVVADTAPEGQKFAYWTDANGKIMSYDTQYKSFPAESIELTAVYVAQNEVIERQPLVFMAADPTTSGEKITYTISWDVAASVGTIKNYGLMIVDADDYNKDTFYHGSGDSKIFDRAVSTSKVSNTTSIAKSDSLYDHTYYAVAYVIYTNSAGESVTMYSDMVEVYKQAP